MPFLPDRGPCKDCPLLGAPEPCLGRSVGYAIFCDYAAGGDVNLRTHVVNHSRLKAGRPPPPTPVRVSTGVVPLPSLREQKWSRGCPYREPCSCSRPSCSEPDRGPRFGLQVGSNFKVDVYACAACLKAYDRGLPAPEKEST